MVPLRSGVPHFYHLPGMLLLYLLPRLQDHLPLNPAGQPAVPPTSR
jgi:K+-transporting ATPase A subunit